MNGKLNQDGRGGVLSTAAVLFAILAISDFLKPLRLEGGDTGLVFFGTRLGGVPNTILGPLFGIFLLVYAAGIWRMRRYALPMGYAYAAYVVINLVMFSAKNPLAGECRPDDFRPRLHRDRAGGVVGHSDAVASPQGATVLTAHTALTPGWRRPARARARFRPAALPGC